MHLCAQSLRTKRQQLWGTMEIDKAILEKFGIIKNSKNVHDKPATLHEKIAAEKELELGMIRSGIRRFHKTVDKSKAKISEKTKRFSQSLDLKWIKKIKLKRHITFLADLSWF